MGEFFVTVLKFLQSFSLELSAASLMFCWHLKRRRHFLPRLLPLIAVILLFSKQFSFIMPWREYGSFSKYPYFQIGNYFNTGFLVVYVCVYLSMLLCFKESPVKILLMCTSGYIVQNLGYQVMESFRYVAFGHNYSVPYMFTAIAVNVVCIGGTGFALIPAYIKEKDIKLKAQFVVPFVIITFIICTGFSKMITVEDRTNILSHIYAAACCLLLLYTQIGFFFKAKADREKDMMEEILKKSSWKQQFSKQNQELINRKYHDLKHEIAALKAVKSDTERAAGIAVLEKSLLAYDASVETGNEALDALLTEKSLICESKGIEFSCIADGAALSFMSATDAYVVLGNAMDNAIEAEEKEAGGERFISLLIKKNSQFAFICIENYVSGKVEFSGGLPITAKKDRHNHGYGTKSIKMIAEGYGGYVKFYCKEERFVLKAVIPVPA